MVKGLKIRAEIHVNAVLTRAISEISRMVMISYRINLISFQRKQACHSSTAQAVYLEKRKGA